MKIHIQTIENLHMNIYFTHTRNQNKGDNQESQYPMKTI